MEFHGTIILIDGWFVDWLMGEEWMTFGHKFTG